MATTPRQGPPILLTPTRRLAHRLRAAHDARCETEGRRVWPTLEALPWQAWLAQEFSLARRAGRENRRLLAPEAAALVWRRIVEDDPGEQGSVSPGGLAAAAHRTWRRMQAWRIPEAALIAETTPETRAFVRWMRRYTHWLAERGAVDPDRIADALEGWTPVRSLRLVGFDEFPPAQAGLLERLRGSGVDIAVESLTVRRGDLSRVDCRDARHELDSAARWAADWLARDPGARLAIVVSELQPRRAEVRRALEQVLLPGAGYVGGPPPESRVFAIADAPPLSERAVVMAAFDLLATFLGVTDVAACGRLLRNPCIQGAIAEDAPRAMLDVWIRRNAAADLPLARLRQLAAARHCPQLAELIERGLTLARQHSGRGSPSAWSERFHELLSAVGWPGEGLSSNEFQVAERLRALLAELTAADEITGPLGAGSALGLLRDFTDRVLFEPQETDAPLVVIEPEAAIGMQFDGLWLTGMEARRWPPPAAPDPFLPRSWQIRVEMPDADATLAERQSRRLFERLVQSADEAVASVAQFDGETPVLASAMIGSLPRRGEPPTWPNQRLSSYIHAARPRPEWLLDARAPRPRPGQPARGGAKLLELQSACPFRADAEMRLHARVLEEPTPGLTPAERGELVHGVLARVWRALADQQTLLTQDPTTLGGLVRASIEAEAVGLRSHATRLTERFLELEFVWLEKRVLELLDCDRARAPFVVDAVEAPRTVVLGGLMLEVKLDRVDRLGDGRLAVIDYKTGGDSEPVAWLGDRPRLPQIPLYTQAVGAERVAAAAFGRVRAGRTGYAGIASDPRTFGGIASFGGPGQPRGFASWEALLAAWRERLLCLAEEYLAGDAHLAPNPATACRHCHLAALCRINETPLRAERLRDADE